MPGSITLPQIVLDLEEEDRKRYEELSAPKAIVVRYGYMRMVAELPYDGDAKPGCGSKLIIRTKRGTEIGEMLTTTCSNNGCGKSVTRQQMLDYIENSGGKDYPFSSQGRILRVATIEDLNEQSKLDSEKMKMMKITRGHIEAAGLPMRLVDIEILLGRERILFHFTSETWIDFRELVVKLAAEFSTRIEMHQVNARDELRIVGDYEKCGQHCCCKQFLKVLKPVSMRSAKVQKATLDPQKISGRCGRLMCCLRDEDETYESLRKRLPNRKSRVMTDDGRGTVIDSQILTQLVLVQLDDAPAPAAYPLENIRLLTKEEDPGAPKPPERQGPGAPTGGPGGAARQGGNDRPPRRDGPRQDGPRQDGPRQGEPRQDRQEPRQEPRPEPRRPMPGAPLQTGEIESREGTPSGTIPGEMNPRSGEPTGNDEGIDSDGPDSPEGGEGMDSGGSGIDQAGPTTGGPEGSGEGQKRRRRRRRRGGRGGGAGGPGAPGGPGSGPADSGGGGQGGPASGPPSV